MDTIKFDWDTNCGSLPSPADAAAECTARGIAPRTYAEEYLAAWPFDTPAPADLVDGMTADIEAEMETTSRHQTAGVTANGWDSETREPMGYSLDCPADVDGDDELDSIVYSPDYIAGSPTESLIGIPADATVIGHMRDDEGRLGQVLLERG